MGIPVNAMNNKAPGDVVVGAACLAVFVFLICPEILRAIYEAIK